MSKPGSYIGVPANRLMISSLVWMRALDHADPGEPARHRLDHQIGLRAEDLREPLGRVERGGVDPGRVDRGGLHDAPPPPPPVA